MNKKIKIGIIGGNGKTGRWFANFFRENGLEVIISDLNTELSNKGLVEKSDAVVFSVPIGITHDIIKEVVPFTRKGQILIDLTSIKTAAVKEMMKSDCEVLSVHPMFSHHVKTIKNQKIIFCKCREKSKTKIFEEMFNKAGAKIKESTPEIHDKIMATIQGLTHFNAIVIAHTLKRLGVNIKESLEYTSPIYKIRMDMIGRIMAQDPRLYAEIESLNPYTQKSVEQMMASSWELFQFIRSQNIRGFIEYFEEASEHFGDFKEKAMKESNFLITKMSEKHNGGKEK